MSIGSFGITPYFDIPDFPDLSELGDTYEAVTSNAVPDSQNIFQKEFSNTNLFTQFTANIIGVNSNGTVKAAFKKTVSVYYDGTNVEIFTQTNDYDAFVGSAAQDLNAFFQGSINDNKLNLVVSSELGQSVSWKAFVRELSADRSLA